jgi:putative transposase
MNENSNVARLRQPEEIEDPLTAILRTGARRLLEQAIEAEVNAFLAAMNDLKLPDGRDRIVRHGHGPERTIQTGIGPVEVRRAKVRDRGGAEAGERIRFTSTILPRWARRTKSLDALLPVLYLRGVSTGDFQEALSALLGKDAPRTCRRPSLPGSSRTGRPTTRAGNGVTCPRGTTSTSGPMASTSRLGWSR